MNTQLPLGLSWRDYATFDNFNIGDNAQLVSSLELADQQFTFVWGESGSGKSHLLQAVCQKAHEKIATQTSSEQLQPVYLPMQELLHMQPGILDGMESMNPVCIDDIQLLAGDSDWEAALFHLFNRTRDHGSRLIVSASAAPTQIDIQLPDLVTRLSWGVSYQLQSLSDDGKRIALQQRATQRGLQLPDDVVQFVLRRSLRDMNSLFELLDKLDVASLVEQRKLTIPFVKQYLD